MIIDYRVIPGGPYEKNNSKEPDHEDLNARLYCIIYMKLLKNLINMQMKLKVIVRINLYL